MPKKQQPSVLGSYLTNLQDDKSRAYQVTDKFLGQLQTIAQTEDRFSDESIALGVLEGGAQGFAVGGVVGAGIGAGLGLVSGLIGRDKDRKKRREEEKRQRRQQVQQVYDSFNQEFISQQKNLSQQELRYSADFANLNQIITQGSAQYNKLIAGDGVRSATLSARKKGLKVQGESAIERTFLSIDSAVDRITDRLDIIDQARKRIKGGDNVDLAKHFLSSYQKQLESEYA